MRESQSSKLNLRYYLTKAHLAVPFYGRRETTQTDGFELEKCKDDWCFEWAGAPRTLISSQLVTFSDRKQQHSQFDLNNVNILKIGRKKVSKSQSWPSYWLIYCVIGSRSAVEIRSVSLFCSRCCWIITVLRNLIYFCADTFECKYTSCTQKRWWCKTLIFTFCSIWSQRNSYIQFNTENNKVHSLSYRTERSGDNEFFWTNIEHVQQKVWHECK